MKMKRWASKCRSIVMNQIGMKFGLFLFAGMRAAAMLSWALYGIFSVVNVAYAQAERQEIINENRLTKVETRIDQIWEEVKTVRSDLKDSTKLNYIAVFGTSGLLGEMGLRLVFRKKKKNDDDGEPV